MPTPNPNVEKDESSVLSHLGCWLPCSQNPWLPAVQAEHDTSAQGAEIGSQAPAAGPVWISSEPCIA